MGPGEERTKLEPRWLYVSVGVLVTGAVALLGLLLLIAGFAAHLANEAMAGF